MRAHGSEPAGDRNPVRPNAGLVKCPEIDPELEASADVVGVVCGLLCGR